MIKPTVGRVLWFWPSAFAVRDLAIDYHDITQPLAATVAYVWNDRSVNLSVIDQNGRQFNQSRVLLIQGDELYKPVSDYCQWMPYQVGQTQKAAES